jgi:transcriptional regulator with XRE-family HTH domain
MKSDAGDLDVLVGAVRALMKSNGLKIPALAKKSGVSPRMIKYILAKQRTPTIDVIQAIAGAFGLKSWQLMIPNVKIDGATSRHLESLVKNYTQSSQQGQEYLDRVAEQEAKYKEPNK